MAIAPAPIASPPEPGIPSTPPPEPPLAPALTVSPEPTVASGTPVLQCIGLRKRFGDRQAVDGVGFAIAPGETYGLLGPNGAGKTTTISMVCGILRRDEGEVFIGGRPFDPSATALKAQIGYVPQDLAIYPDLSAQENLRYFGQLYGLGGSRPKHARRGGPRDRRPGRSGEGTDKQYSGGMKRRLNIAIGLLHDQAC